MIVQDRGGESCLPSASVTLAASPATSRSHSLSSACCGVRRFAGSGCSSRESSDVTWSERCSGHITCARRSRAAKDRVCGAT
eukprot:3008934-Pleurochrysis_carterae.AAC.2